MREKISSVLSKVSQEKQRGNFSKAIKRLNEAIAKYSGELKLYTEAMTTSLEAGESLSAGQFLKKALERFPDQRDTIMGLAKEHIKTYNDSFLTKIFLEQAVKKRNLVISYEILKSVDDRTVRDLVKRNHAKKMSLSSVQAGGPALRGEMIINTFIEALLYLRENKRIDAAKAIIHILDEKPVENRTIEPFLSQLNDGTLSDGAILYPLGCCFLISKKYDEALETLVQSARLTHEFSEEISSKLEAARSCTQISPADLEITLTELYLIRGDIPKAIHLIGSIIENHPEKSALLLDMILLHADKTGDSLPLNIKAIDVAIALQQEAKALKRITMLASTPELKDNILDWLGDQYKSNRLPSKIKLYYGETIMGEDRLAEGLEVMKEITRSSPSDLPAVLRVIEKHMSKDPKLKEFHEQFSTIESTPDVEVTPDDEMGDDIVHFEKSSFEFRSNISNDNKLDVNNDRFQIESDPKPFGKTYKKLFTEPLFGNDSGQDPFTTNPPEETNEADSRKNEPQNGGKANPGEKPISNTSEDRVNPQHNSSYPQEQLAEKPDMDNLDVAADDPKASLDEITLPTNETQPDISKIFDNIEDALAREDNDRVKELLNFKTTNEHEDGKRKYYLARFYLLKDEPTEALAILKSIPLDTIQVNYKHEILMKMVTCFRHLNMFDAALGTLLKIAKENPSYPLIKKMLKQNYSDYMREQSKGASVLEKVGRINDPLKRGGK